MKYVRAGRNLPSSADSEGTEVVAGRLVELPVGTEDTSV